MDREKGEARLRFLDGDFEVLQPGAYVVCAVTGTHIPLDALRYWSVDLQEAYASPAIATKRMQEKGLVALIHRRAFVAVWPCFCGHAGLGRCKDPKPRAW